MSRHKAVHCDVMTYKISNSLEAVIIRHYVAPWLVEGPYEYIGAMADTDSALAIKSLMITATLIIRPYVKTST